MNQQDAALASLLTDAKSARWWQENRGKGGQHTNGGPPVFWNCPLSALIHIERTCRHGMSGDALAEYERNET